MFNHLDQYRCTIIRGKAQTELDNLLPAYCRIISSICPIDKSSFTTQFNERISSIIGHPEEKTIHNHRTEIAGKLFGLWYEKENIVYSSNKTEKYIESSDNPSLFKDIIVKFQFPNGMDKKQTILERIEQKIRFRPAPFIYKLLNIADEKGLFITKNEIAYYVLNCLPVLQGGVSPEEVIAKIIEMRDKNYYAKVETLGKASSYSMQHITELLNLFELSNTLYCERLNNDVIIRINRKEKSFTNDIIENYSGVLSIDPYKYDLNSDDGFKKFIYDWEMYFSNAEIKSLNQETKVENLFKDEVVSINEGTSSQKGYISTDSLTIGDEGEKIAMDYERNRVGLFNKRLVNKVIYFGKQRGLGYDISSIFAEKPNPEHAIYIEVKSTRRVTAPPSNFTDQFDMTRNEWIAAEQYQNNYFIYRVYLHNKGVKIIKIESPVKLKNEDKIFAEPLKYHIEFDDKVGKCIHER